MCGCDLFTGNFLLFRHFCLLCRYTFEVAPVFTLMEEVVLRKMRDIVGYTEGDGIFTPGT